MFYKEQYDGKLNICSDRFVLSTLADVYWKMAGWHRRCVVDD